MDNPNVASPSALPAAPHPAAPPALGYCPTCRLPLSPSGHRQCACSTTTLLVRVVADRLRAVPAVPARRVCGHGEDVTHFKCGWCLCEATGMSNSAALMLEPFSPWAANGPGDEDEVDDLDSNPPLFVHAPEAA